MQLRSVTCFLAFLAVLSFLLSAPVKVSAQQLDNDGSGGLLDGGALSDQTSQQLLEQLGIPSQQLEQLREHSATGGVGNTETQKLCATVAAKHFSPDETESMGRALGLSDDDLTRLVDCARLASHGNASRFGARDFRDENLDNSRTPEEPSALERRFHSADTPYEMLAAPKLNTLEQFGYKLFIDRGENLATFDSTPVSSDYIVGPGDELNVLLWGRINHTLKLSVQRDGTILIPQIGPLPVAGLNFAAVQKLIDSQMGEIEGVQCDVTMGRLRSIEVFVIGQVVEPGIHTVNALADVSDALGAASGVQKTGSLRRVELLRNNRLIGLIDLYSVLLHGDMSTNVRLEPRDVIFVPVIGPVVGIAGNVKNPAIYELKGRETLTDAIRIGGGVSAFGYGQRVQVERVQNHQQRIALDVGLDTFEARNFIVNDGDLVKVFTVLPERTNVVKLEGNVNRPGEYEWQSGMRVADLIRQGQGVGDHTFFDYALLKRRVGPSQKTNFTRVNLGEAISSELSPEDEELAPGDTLTIYNLGEINEIPTATVKGDVRKPGVYALSYGMRISDLIYEAGGPRSSAYLDQAQLARTESDGTKAQFVYEDINLRSALAGSATDNLELQNGDQIAVAEASDWHRPWVVQVRGEAMRPGPYVIHEGERLASVLERCGGVRTDGYLAALILTRESVKKMQEENLKRASVQLDMELTRAALMPAENNQQQQPNVQQKAEALKMLKDLLSQSGQQQAIGRIVLTVSSLDTLRGSISDVPLEDEDQIIIPKRPSSVNVMGQVYGATAVAYDSSLTMADYIDRAGGLSQEADKDQIFVVKANGAIISETGFKDSGKNRIFPLLPLVSGGMMSARLEPGDTIYVPAKLLFVNPLQRTLDITQIVANAAQGIAYAALLGTLLP